MKKITPPLNNLKTGKVSLFDRGVVQIFSGVVAIFATFATLYTVFWQIPDDKKACLGICFVTLLFVIYVSVWIYANCMKKAHLKINGTNVNIIVGDIFAQDGLKVIGANDFMDTIVDDRIIAKQTLHGKFLDGHKGRIDELNRLIECDDRLKEFVINRNVPRNPGKSTRYKLGTVFEFDTYVLTAFAKFDAENKAFLSAEEYVGFWMSFWQNIDTIYAGRSIYIPLMGAGITRFRGLKPTKQQLLEIMLWTLKISGFQCTYSQRSINFIIYPDDADEIDFFRIKRR